MEANWLENPGAFVETEAFIGNADSDGDGGISAQSETLDWNVSAALGYAARYCSGTCECGKFYDSNDCTHFLSHFLSAGGLRFYKLRHACPQWQPTFAPELLQMLLQGVDYYTNLHRVYASQVTCGDFGFSGDLNYVSHAFIFNSSMKPSPALPGKYRAHIFGHTRPRCGEAVDSSFNEGVYFRIT